jgi:hypothetical protein
VIYAPIGFNGGVTMVHYGLKRKNTNGWLRDVSGMIFWTTSRVVADEQKNLLCDPDEFEVCKFMDDVKAEQSPLQR